MVNFTRLTQTCIRAILLEESFAKSNCNATRRDAFSSPEPVVSWSRGRETREPLVGYKLRRVALGTRMDAMSIDDFYGEVQTEKNC